MNWNRHRYNKAGDAIGLRTSKWYKQQVFPLVPKCFGTVLDVGCGNGRLTPLIEASQVHAIDPACDYLKKFEREWIYHTQEKFLEVTGKYDAVFFLGSLWIIWLHHGYDAVEHIGRILRAGGFVFALLNANNKLPVLRKQWAAFGLLNIKVKHTEDKSSKILEAWKC